MNPIKVPANFLSKNACRNIYCQVQKYFKSRLNFQLIFSWNWNMLASDSKMAVRKSVALNSFISKYVARNNLIINYTWIMDHCCYIQIKQLSWTLCSIYSLMELIEPNLTNIFSNFVIFIIIELLRYINLSIRVASPLSAAGSPSNFNRSKPFVLNVKGQHDVMAITIMSTNLVHFVEIYASSLEQIY